MAVLEDENVSGRVRVGYGKYLRVRIAEIMARAVLNFCIIYARFLMFARVIYKKNFEGIKVFFSPCQLSHGVSLVNLFLAVTER